MSTSRGEYIKKIINLSTIRKLAVLGLNIKEICGQLQISRSKWDRHCKAQIAEKDDPNAESDIMLAYQRGRSQGISEILLATREAALSGSTHAQKILLDSFGGYSKQAPTPPAIENKGATLNLFLTPSSGEVNPGVTIDQETSETTAGLNIILQK